MSDFQIRKASKKRAKARVLIAGPAGSGKTWTAIHIAAALGGSTVIIDTEAGTSNKYANIIDDFVFDVLELEAPYGPERYKDAIEFAEDQGYANIIVDSLTHAWNGEGGALEQVNMAAKRYGGNSHYAWADVTPKHNALFQKVVQSSSNIIGTMRTKTEYAKQDQGAYKKIGTKVIQRDETDYEFDVVLRMDIAHNGFVEKSRIPELDNTTVVKPGIEFGNKIKQLLQEGVEGEGELVAKRKNYPHTKKGLISLAAEEYEMDQFAVRDALADANLDFENAGWDELTAAVKDFATEPAETE